MGVAEGESMLRGRLLRHVVYWIPAFAGMTGGLLRGWRNPDSEVCVCLEK